MRVCEMDIHMLKVYKLGIRYLGEGRKRSGNNNKRDLDDYNGLCVL